MLDISPQGEEPIYVVLEFIDGRTLADILQNDRPTTQRLVEIVVRICEAIDYAHKAGLVHRDLKPANILIDARGDPFVADFGLAINEDLERLRWGEIAGTPRFMAPEQVRGETHRLDGRTDLWAIGVILYIGLTGRPPFISRDRDEIFDEILNSDPKPPRLCAGSEVPRELERICLKCLAKRMGDRYQTAADLVEDLQLWQSTADLSETVTATVPRGAPERFAPPVRVVPKGLRAFDVEDADFFLSLLPGPRDRDGLPESIRAWKTRIDSTDPSQAFPRRPALRSVRLRQVVPGQGRVAAPPGRARDADLHRGQVRRHRVAPSRRHPQKVPGNLPKLKPGRSSRVAPRRDRRVSRNKGADRPRSVRAVAAPSRG